ncbi:MAG: STN domain-containing protein, partial [Pseudomonadota bacterium]
MTSRLRFSAAGFFWLCLSVPMGAMAQTDGAALPAQGIDIPSQPLIDALGALGDLAGYQVSADADLLEGRRSAAVIGAPSPEAALTTMLSGTGLTFRSLGADGAVLER